MADFNDIGIPRQLDWPRVRKLLTIGVFGAYGFHVPTCALVFLGKQGLPEETLARFALYFLLPATALFWVFFLLLAVTQIAAFAKGRTPYPRWCWVFSPLVGGLAAQALGFLGNLPLLNAIACAWLAIGCLWMFGGLLILAKSAERRSNSL